MKLLKEIMTSLRSLKSTNKYVKLKEEPTEFDQIIQEKSSSAKSFLAVDRRGELENWSVSSRESNKKSNLVEMQDLFGNQYEISPQNITTCNQYSDTNACNNFDKELMGAVLASGLLFH